MERQVNRSELAMGGEPAVLELEVPTLDQKATVRMLEEAWQDHTITSGRTKKMMRLRVVENTFIARRFTLEDPKVEHKVSFGSRNPALGYFVAA